MVLLYSQTLWKRTSLCLTLRSLGDKREEGFKALTVWITFDGQFRKELAEREVSPWRMFYSLRRLLCNDKGALKHRVRLFSSCVVSYRCAGSWLDTHHSAPIVGRFKIKMLIYVPRTSMEKEDSRMMRWARLLLNCRFKNTSSHTVARRFSPVNFH